MVTITRHTKISAYGRADGVDRIEYADGKAQLEHLDRHSAFVGETFLLRVGEKRIQMQAAQVTVISPGHGWVEGFVEVSADGEALHYLDDDHTGIFCREMWTWYS